jgi:hypothetical protein
MTNQLTDPCAHMSSYHPFDVGWIVHAFEKMFPYYGHDSRNSDHSQLNRYERYSEAFIDLEKIK